MATLILRCWTLAFSMTKVGSGWSRGRPESADHGEKIARRARSELSVVQEAGRTGGAILGFFEALRHEFAEGLELRGPAAAA
ncbi:MAG: hypothetical protein M9883_03915 [Methylobacteriaceae bacterium]|nr:hypothetical protein [Methylobacteriaceae bacterium]